MPPSSSSALQPVEPNVQLAAKHSLLMRSLHWLNAVAISALIGTGIVLLIGGDALATLGGSIHQVFYFLLLGIGAVYLTALIVSGGWRMFLPTRETVADASAVVKSELHLGAHAPRLKKYNGAQRLAYGAVLLMVAGEIVTGLAMAYRHQIPWLGVLLGGRHTVHTIHKVLMFGIIAFVFAHVVQVARAGWPSLRSMLCGYDIVPVGSFAAIDGAFPDHLGAPVTRSAGQQKVDTQTRRGFVGVGAAAALGLALVAVGSVRGSAAENARDERDGQSLGGEDEDGDARSAGDRTARPRKAANANDSNGEK